MHDYLFSSEFVRLAFVLGIVVSLVTYQRSHLTTGSIVVPGYIGMFVFMPITIAATFANALTTYWLVNKVIRKRYVLYGRDKFAAQALISIGIQVVMIKLSPQVPWLWESRIPLLVGVGYVIPALIAHDMARQGIKKTVRAVMSSGLTVALLLMVFLIFIPGSRADQTLVGFDALSFSPSWIPFAVILSALTAWALLKNHSLRGGGFIGVAYLSVLGSNPWQLVFLATVAVLSYLIVTKMLMPAMILFGRRKFAAMLVVSGLLSWVGILLGALVFGIDIRPYQTLASIALTPIFVPGLLANDIERSGMLRVGAGAVLGLVFVLSTTLWAQGFVEGIPVDKWMLPLAIVSGLIVFEGQWEPLIARTARKFLPQRKTGRYEEASRGVLAPWVSPTGRHVRPSELVG